jgi:hypothetical protein
MEAKKTQRFDSAYFIVSVLDLFDKQLTITDIQEAEVPFLVTLIEAKEKLIAEKEKIRKKQEAEQQRNMSKPATNGGGTSNRNSFN